MKAARKLAASSTIGLRIHTNLSDDENPKSLQKFVSIHSSVHNHFSLDRPLINRQQLKFNRNAAPTKWRQLAI